MQSAALLKVVVADDKFGVDDVEGLPLYLLELFEELSVLPGRVEDKLFFYEHLLFVSVDQEDILPEVPCAGSLLLDEVPFELTDLFLGLGTTHFSNIFIDQQ